MPESGFPVVEQVPFMDGILAFASPPFHVWV